MYHVSRLTLRRVPSGSNERTHKRELFSTDSYIISFRIQSDWTKKTVGLGFFTPTCPLCRVRNQNYPKCVDADIKWTLEVVV